MLTIRREQAAMMEEATRNRLARDVVESLKESSPHSLQGLSEAEQEERFATALAKADNYGFRVIRMAAANRHCLHSHRMKPTILVALWLCCL